MTSEFLTIFKNSSLALTIGLLELTAQSQQIAEYTFQGFEAYTAATVIYVLHRAYRDAGLAWSSGTRGSPAIVREELMSMASFDFGVIASNLPFLWQGLQLSLAADAAGDPAAG